MRRKNETLTWIEGIVTASPTPMRNLHASRVSRDTPAAVGDSICAADQTSTPVVMVAFGPHTPIITDEGIMDAMYPQENTLLICISYSGGRGWPVTVMVMGNGWGERWGRGDAVYVL